MAETATTNAAIARSMLAWCGVTSPTPSQYEVALLAVDSAVDTINHYRQTDALEAAYVSLAVEMATYLYQKRGADGAVSYGENGVQRSFEKGSFPPSMLARISLPTTSG